ncbi:hypothetical protein [Paenibacillus sp. Soil724D2]|uniref:hypothetical protein n=1 Tax=Paenibacillus sp. (strain Soil724D2) TaxID=1736392 RepID=UPI000715526C|nr:hypothetical protein [Paenibacillus sp. Soil724D2]KRE48937.1 hypothetical protein ASG85_25860 [Paenibacillus sp. Soil724D2]
MLIRKIVIWSALIFFAFFLTILSLAKEYPYSIPRAILAIETGHARLVPLTSDASKLIGRRGPSEQQLTAYLAQRGWRHKETLGVQIIYEKDNVTLNVYSHFRKGFWWYVLDRSP